MDKDPGGLSGAGPSSCAGGSRETMAVGRAGGDREVALQLHRELNGELVGAGGGGMALQTDVGGVAMSSNRGLLTSTPPPPSPTAVSLMGRESLLEALAAVSRSEGKGEGASRADSSSSSSSAVQLDAAVAESLIERVASEARLRPRLSAQASRRVELDVTRVRKLKYKNVRVERSKEADDVVKVWVAGSEGRAGDGAVFAGVWLEFDVIFPADYPWSAPGVTLVTGAGSGAVVHPHLRPPQPLALPVLGNCPGWEGRGPVWTPSSTLESIVVSLVALLSPRPWAEAGVFGGSSGGSSEGELVAAQIALHQVLRFCVCEPMEEHLNGGGVHELAAEQIFGLRCVGLMSHVDEWCELCRLWAPDVDGLLLEDPLRLNVGVFDFAELLARLDALRTVAASLA
ncbi:uncharacterized protein AMSG_01082 [Thecamonas trahens ATCC 50062]|uniref:UBC core domain-containing protein n=1 Tax=Thecamonas trahens ATCC 50062 TaxID=461836 RepID=A0A0L0DLH9_THETB|nr:hypothetical protein AMSG_01082 [Thecamonas trahens ATCC 50062]KNC52253.1 hypothetical protein AMSG_01082 [Thecamonas trahens ATCC 50062]|eukprot:XP_013762255.1 hypothetical protein AMSG_01082 [Thecamonas trahens ATCC 50062]